MGRPRKKRPKLPNGFGSIKYLGEGRSKPYAPFPSTKEWSKNGPVTPKALGYFETYDEAHEILSAYNLERKGMIKVNQSVYISRTPLFKEVYEKYFTEKYNNPKKKLSKASKNSTQAAFKNCSALYDMKFGDIRYDDLQNVLNDCELKHSSIELIVSLMHQMFRYAIKHDIVERDYSVDIYIPLEEDDEHGEPFSYDDLKLLWKHNSDPVVQMTLIMCYSGYRITAFTKMGTHIDEKYFHGGVKTRASIERNVPIHSGILQFVINRYSGKNLLGCTPQAYRTNFYKVLDQLGILYTETGKKHTPHDCRHTFSMLCEKYKVNENDRKRMMGHAFNGDITNSIYGHRSIEDLRTEIEKIPAPDRL